eukprot:Gb_18350 [translate_table: standard]
MEHTVIDGTQEDCRKAAIEMETILINDSKEKGREGKGVQIKVFSRDMMANGCVGQPSDAGNLVIDTVKTLSEGKNTEDKDVEAEEEVASAIFDQWEEVTKDLHLASRPDYDEEIATVLISILFTDKDKGWQSQDRFIHDKFAIVNSPEVPLVVVTPKKVSRDSNEKVQDKYAKYGNMKIACQLFAKMPERNNVSWSAMLFRNGSIQTKAVAPRCGRKLWARAEMEVVVKFVATY